MPELPEVEATRRHLESVIVGRVIESAEVRRDRMTRRHERPDDFIDRVAGRRVESLGRLGKFLLVRLEGEITWVTHLGMSGRLALATDDEPEAPHTNVVIRLDDGREVRMVDPRTFGFVAAWTPEEMDAEFGGRVGRDALDDLPATRDLASALDGRTAPIKALLLDQRVVAGLGNIYVDEILHRARIRPDRRAGTLTSSEIADLRAAVRPVLEAGLRHGGTSLDDLAYLLPDGRAGEYLHRLAAYGREGEACRRCGGIIERTVIRSRSSFWCRRCQV
ncbi:MAG TPA: bifunctional DNA-formamidopyrimidine glycosylase/DNA-(apurinic or apyrimidinic site) lyase [Acidimicrobiia bacterium]|nr:bifunctional DNA-formamidopyrimidine glycosylase/DNA-(apurinic or apyrimidinic site) lyase [Acidimicrobiia bacterium]